MLAAALYRSLYVFPWASHHTGCFIGLKAVFSPEHNTHLFLPRTSHHCSFLFRIPHWVCFSLPIWNYRGDYCVFVSHLWCILLCRGTLGCLKCRSSLLEARSKRSVRMKPHSPQRNGQSVGAPHKQTMKPYTLAYWDLFAWMHTETNTHKLPVSMLFLLARARVLWGYFILCRSC